MNNFNHYNVLADLFRYPTLGYKEHVVECSEMLQEKYPELHEGFLPFINVINNLSIIDVEELFGMTFHIQAVCYLDLGYVLYAEDYKRGEFLVQMKNEQERVNNDLGVELADNLPNALSLLPLLEDSTFREELAIRMYTPALESMIKEFDTSRLALKAKVRKRKQKVLIKEDLKNKNAYQFAIQTVLNVLRKDFKTEEFQDQQVKTDPLSSFLPNCDSACATPTTNDNPVISE